MKYLSFFSGIGGFELALENTFGSKAHCCGYSEIDEYALQVYQKHFPHHANAALGDISKISNSQIVKLYQQNGHIDLIVGGFPCQNLSSANVRGERDGLDGQKSGLFFELLRIIKTVYKLNKDRNRPTYIILENVKTRHHETTAHLEKVFGKGTITETELDSSPFSAQKRIRFIWTNFNVTALPTKKGPLLSSVLLPIASVPVELQKSDKAIAYLNKTVNVSSAVPRNIQQLQLVKTDARGFNHYQIVDKGTSYSKKVRWQLYGISDSNDDKSKTICRWDQVIFDRRFGQNQFVVRDLQPEEIEKLFTFPVGWTKDVSKTRRLSMLGNAVVVKAIQFITDALKAQ